MRALFIAGFNQTRISKPTDDLWMLGLQRSLSKYSLTGEITITDTKKQCLPPQEIFTNVSLGLRVEPHLTGQHMQWLGRSRPFLWGPPPSPSGRQNLFQQLLQQQRDCWKPRKANGEVKPSRRPSSTTHPFIIQAFSLYNSLKIMSLCLAFSHFRSRSLAISWSPKPP